jgi:hypothetical protein
MRPILMIGPRKLEDAISDRGARIALAGLAELSAYLDKESGKPTPIKRPKAGLDTR